MYYFISDVHIGYYPRQKEREREKLLIEFLKKIESNCHTLYIIGDLFDYWFEYKTVIPRDFIRVISALINMRDKNIKIEYIIGNHDFGHKDFFADELGINLHQNDIETTIEGKSFFLSHGDGKIKKDHGYNILKKILRNPLSNKLYRLIHPDLGIMLASSSSKTSRNYTEKKDYGTTDSLFEFAQSKISEGFDYVILGHRHKIYFEKIGNGYYVNLGEWFVNPHFGKFDGENFNIASVKQFISE